MFTAMKSFIGEQIGQIRDAGLYKGERVITSPQRMHITVAGGAGKLRSFRVIEGGGTLGIRELGLFRVMGHSA